MNNFMIIFFTVVNFIPIYFFSLIYMTDIYGNKVVVTKFYPETHIKFPARIIISSKTNTGKSHYIRWLLYLNYEKIDRLVVYAYSKDDGYEDLTRYYYSDYKPEYMDDLIKMQEDDKIYIGEEKGKGKYQYPHTVVIMDDFVGNVNMTFQKGIDKLFTQGRHYNITVIVTTQKYKSVSNVMRGNAGYIILFSQTNMVQTNGIAEEYNIYEDKNNFYILLNKHTDKYGCVIIDNTKNKIEYHHDRAEKKIGHFTFIEV